MSIGTPGNNVMARRFAIVVATALAVAPAGCQSDKLAGKSQDLFGIFTATIDGRNVKMIVSDSTRQMTHTRVSPDEKWITFTRYNNKGLLSGLAEEEDGYEDTEIVIARIDGSGMETVVPPKRGIVASNGSWVDGGRALQFVSTDNPERVPQIKVIDLQTRKTSRVPTPPGLKATDPNRVGNRIVFPAKGKTIDSLWTMNLDGSQAKQLTRPSGFAGKGSAALNLGDYDPKLSPDGRTVAFMRNFGDELWRIYVADVATGRENSLSTRTTSGSDTLPEWSSDGGLLVFWHFDRRNLPATGIYTMRPDGSERRMVPLPRGQLHGNASFFPNDGSGKDARIIYTAKRMPRMP